MGPGHQSLQGPNGFSVLDRSPASLSFRASVPAALHLRKVDLRAAPPLAALLAAPVAAACRFLRTRSAPIRLNSSRCCGVSKSDPSRLSACSTPCEVHRSELRTLAFVALQRPVW